MIFRFEECELDLPRYELRRAGEVLRLEPQVFEVLRYLLANRERLVTKEELLDAVWGHRFVTPATLNSRLKTLRRAIGDDGKRQRLVRTVHGRGFRVVAAVDIIDDDPVPPSREVESPAPDAAEAHVATVQSLEQPAESLVARDEELARLTSLLEGAGRGRRTFAFLTGEPGIGKSTLAAAFLSGIGGELFVARGQCLEQRGPSEPYFPLLDALGRLGRGSAGPTVVDELERVAPTWLAQLPALASADRLDEARRRSFGSTQPRMLREMAEALEAISTHRPLVLFLDDLHWCDPATLDLLAWVGERSEPARLLVVGTFRPGDAEGPLRTLVARLGRSCQAIEITLRRWGREELERFCATRFVGTGLTSDLLELAHRRSEGNPLFARSLIESWVEEGVVVGSLPLEEIAQRVPESLRLLLEQSVDRLADSDQRILESAAVVGPEFGAALVASALDTDEESIEERCEALSRGDRFLRAVGLEEWPDGTISGRYAFTHDLLQQAVHQRIPESRRARLHRRVGERLERALGPSIAARAAELAVHFVAAHDDPRAVEYLRLAAEQAVGRSAHREAIGFAENALAILDGRPDFPDRLRVELMLQRVLGPARLLTRGWGDPAAEQAYLRARELSERLGDLDQLAQVLHGMAYVHEIRGEFQRSEPILETCIGLSGEAPGPYTSVESHELLSCSFFHQGRFPDALGKAELAMAAFRPGVTGDPFAATLGMNAAVAAHFWAGLALWCIGFPDRALAPVGTGLRLANQSQLIYMQAAAHSLAAELYQFRGDIPTVVEHAEAALAISTRQGYPFHHAVGLTLRGWANVAQGETELGLEQLQRGIAMQAAAGADMERPYALGLAADGFLRASKAADGFAAVGEALELIERRARTFFWEAELFRTRGELWLLQGDREPATRDFERALAIATRQGAVSLQLRAALSLVRLSRAGADGRHDRRRLRSLLEGFTEGFDTADLQSAAALLDPPTPR
jgi:DNA-binding winged helix-turn-helix (wHTH) protein/tetratricopeptide (TPR) repeat protein